ncbi:hypothetical protein [Janthinobacterium sp. LM6]|uniref:hypothetical protein n=1 Tax=Janthinobacterium sp. LM6 TaxID=1938606 RepID=UPI0012377C4B|nr:hypothetical protein [Janthinobacterium sp. LM6]
MTVKRGWYRLWVICAFFWIIFALVRWNAIYEFTYAVSYYFDRKDFAIDEANSFCPIHITLRPQEEEPEVMPGRSQLADILMWEREMATQTASDNIVCNPPILAGYGGQERSTDEIHQCLLKRIEARAKEAAAADEKKNLEKKQIAVELEKLRVKQCIREFKLSEPSWTALALTFLPPTIGVILVLLMLRGLYVAFRWVWRGFQ